MNGQTEESGKILNGPGVKTPVAVEMLRTPQHTHWLNIEIRCDAKEGTSIRTAESVIRVISCAKNGLRFHLQEVIRVLDNRENQLCCVRKD